MRSRMRNTTAATLISLAAACAAVAGDDPTFDTEAFNRCLLEKVGAADDETTVGEIRLKCLAAARGTEPDLSVTAGAADSEPVEGTPLDDRIEDIKATENLGFVITPFRPNYLMVGYNPDPNSAPFEEAIPQEDFELNTAEIKFQISFMFPIAADIFKNNGDLYFAYTNRSFWQAFNGNLSAVFRETNHEPEFWLQLDNDTRILGFTNRLNAIGFDHQSNGQNRPLSRGWSRIFANFIFARDNLVVSLRPWIIVGNISDNPDIRDYMGNIEVQGAYKWRHNTFSLLLRNNLQSGFSRGTFQLDWSFPVYRRLRGYAQYFNGYGESLIDYNVHTNTIGVGVSFTDYF